jgi:histidine ammonia-lyase
LAHAVMVVDKMYKCLSHADLIGSLMIEGLMGSQTPFYKELHQTRPFKGNIHVAARMRTFLKDSEIGNSHTNCGKVQDPYSMRCIPQVHGSSRNAWLHLKEVVETEMNSVTDNPVIISEDLIISGGSFHGQPLAMPLDYACLAAAELGSISDRRTYLSLEGKYDGTPRLLLKDTGLNSGFMIPQYTAASIVSQNKQLCTPASIDSIESSNGQEDHVSMGANSATKLYRVMNNVEQILAIELYNAAQAIGFRKAKTSPFLEGFVEMYRGEVSFVENDRYMHTDMVASVEFLRGIEIDAEILYS